jgi:ubiquinone/menaquinone biosynthesis C-methylase UbiE
MVAQAEKNIKACGHERSIEVQVAAANNLPFAHGEFDCVISTGSIHHWKDSTSALSEVYRVLRVDGYALMYDMVREMPKDISEAVRRQFGHFRFALVWLHSFEEPFLSPKEMETLGRKSDFVVQGTRFIGALCCLVLRKTAAIEGSA